WEAASSGSTDVQLTGDFPEPEAPLIDAADRNPAATGCHRYLHRSGPLPYVIRRASRHADRLRSTCCLQAEKLLRIAVRDALPVRGADGNVVEKFARFRHRSVRMVDREHDPRDADLQQQIEKRCREIETRKGLVDIFPEIRAKRASKLGQF